jgi:hypothetical protein
MKNIDFTYYKTIIQSAAKPPTYLQISMQGTLFHFNFCLLENLINIYTFGHFKMPIFKSLQN